MAGDVYAGLVDQYGRPIDKAVLATEQAKPSSFFSRNPYAPNPAAGLTPDRLANILRSSIDGSPALYLALAEDMEERYPQYASTLSTRKRAVMGLEISVEAASNDPQDVKEADFIRDFVKGAVFRGARIDVLDALGKGFSAIELIWDTGASAWLPSAMRYRDPRFFEFDQVDPEHLLLLDQGGRVDLRPWGWVVHRAKAKSGLTIRGGIARQVAWLYLFQSFTARDWAIFCEAYGQPIRIGKYGPDASEDDKAALMAAVQNIAIDFAGIIPASMAVEIVNAQLSGSNDLFVQRAGYLDQQCSKIVLGQTGTTDVIKGGGYASSKVHDLVREDITESDAEQIADTLNAQLVPPLVLLNFPPRARTGLPQIKIGRPEEEDVEAWVKNVALLVPFGLPVSISEAQEKIGSRPPQGDEALLQPPAAPTSPALLDSATEAASTAGAKTARGTDAIGRAAADILSGDGWEPLISPVVDGLADELAAATSLDEAKAVLQRRAETMGTSAFADLLARSAFAARLLGETGDVADETHSASYNPAEQRDGKGRWSDGEGALVSKLEQSIATEVSSAPLSDLPEDEFEDVGQDSDAALMKFQDNLYAGAADDDFVENARALQKYSEQDYAPINKALRSGHVPDQYAAQIDHLDQAVANWKTPKPLTVWRGVSGEFAEKMESMSKGDRFIDRGFVSASLSSSVPAEFAEGSPMLKILLPAGTNAYPMNAQGYSHYSAEHEMLLGRNMTFEVRDVRDGEIVLEAVP